jgi:ATP-dependent Clp protease adaptor protein ClpS
MGSFAVAYRGSIAQETNVSETKSAAATVEPEVAVAEPKKKRKSKPRRQPRYNVILWNDDDHSYDYVIEMMRKLFGHDDVMGFKIADEVHRQGRAICLTTTLEHAELKRDQIHAYGPDKDIKRCKGSMSATIEAECGE